MAGTGGLSGGAGLKAAPHLEARLERRCTVAPVRSFSPVSGTSPPRRCMTWRSAVPAGRRSPVPVPDRFPYSGPSIGGFLTITYSSFSNSIFF